jgi:26S proteasome regulatory subunit T3
MLAKAVAN